MRQTPPPGDPRSSATVDRQVSYRSGHTGIRLHRAVCWPLPKFRFHNFVSHDVNQAIFYGVSPHCESARTVQKRFVLFHSKASILPMI